MTAPWLQDAPSLAAIPVGLAFGAALERAGLGSARTIADQLRGRDFTVIKVMFSAILTAMLGVFWASRLGWLDLSRVAIPETDLGPQLIGAVLFGAGFSIASLCPGTACVAAGSGHRDGWVAIGGLLVGTLAVMLAWPALGSVAERAPRPDALLPNDLGLPTGVVVAAITVLGVVVLRLASRIDHSGSPPRPLLRTPTPLGVAALSIGLLAGLAPDRTATPVPTPAAADGLDPLDLAQWIKEGRPGLRVIDVREGPADSGYAIPGSVPVLAAELAGVEARPGEVLVLAGSGPLAAWAIAAARVRLGALVLRDGLTGWEDEVMSPHPPIGADSAGLARWRRARELSLWFGGFPSSTPKAARSRGTMAPRRNRC